MKENIRLYHHNFIIISKLSKDVSSLLLEDTASNRSACAGVTHFSSSAIDLSQLQCAPFPNLKPQKVERDLHIVN